MTVADPRQSATPPGPKGSRLVRLARAALDPLAFVTEMTAQHGEFVRLREGRFYLSASPDGAQRILQDNHQNYEKGPLYRQALRPLMGDGLFVAEGETWKRRRHIARPAFSRTSHDVFARVIVAHYAEMQERWMTAARESRPVNLVSEVMHLTLKIGFRIIFSDSLDDRKVDELVTAFLACEHEMNIARPFYPVHLPSWVPTPSAVRFRRSMRILEDFAYGVIQSRRQRNDSSNDLLGIYLRASLEDGALLEDVAIRDEILTLLAAGQSVTDGVCWMFLLLTRHPEVAARIQAETDSVVGTRLPALSDLERLPYASMSVKESLRLYPPAWGFMRTALEDDVVCGYHIPAGSGIIVSPYLTHRLPRLWEDPERFDPARFTPDRSGERHRFAWFPFGQGPRKCIGAGLALLEMELLLPFVYQAFNVRAAPGPPIRPVTRISMKQNRPLHLMLTPRPEFPARRG